MSDDPRHSRESGNPLPELPVKWHTREDSGLELDEQQRWWHDSVRIEHPKIVEAFNQGLQVQDDGRVKLTFGNDWCFVKVHACAFTVVALDVSQDRFSIRLSDRTAEWLDVGTLQLDETGVFTCAVKNGKARARFSREAQFQLASLGEYVGGVLVLQAGTSRVATLIPEPVAH